MNTFPLRVVIVGAGAFGTKRLEACLALPKQFTVVGVIDPDAARQSYIKKTYALPAPPSFSKLSTQADLAIIATPNAYHANSTIDAIRRGMHVLCEKPLATSTRDAKRIVTAAHKYRRYVKMGSNHRFFPTIQKAYEIVNHGTIGEILLFRGNIGTNGSRVAHTWFWDKQLAGGGTLIDNGSHLVDLARLFMGELITHKADMTTTYWHDAKVEDNATVIFRTSNLRRAIISSSWTQWSGYMHIELWGKKGYIIINSDERETVTIGDKQGNHTLYDYTTNPKDSYQRELLYVAGCIHSHKQPEPNAQDGAAVISLIEAAYKSSNIRNQRP